MQDFEINNRLWIAKNGKPFLGIGKIILLEKVDAEGSINKAAKSIGMSYKRAWQMINSINDAADELIVIRQTGGAGGGGTSLTEKGRKIINEYRRIDNMCRELLNAEMENCCF